ncbi:isoamylase [Treponema sp. TIM-1]|uniref:isoamylase n=1 Tax=Treponema sp. TIM-1 TaxID=2898417 RepID=UPI0039813DDB
MKKLIPVMFLMAIIGSIGALDTESYAFLDHLLSLNSPKAPEIYEDGVLFTAPSSHRRVGIAFSHEGFSRVHWFQKLMVTEEPGETPAPGKKDPPLSYRDSGISFYVFTIPEELTELEYRLVIDGLWTFDPLNPQTRTDPVSGQIRSVIAFPKIARPFSTTDNPPGCLNFNFTAPPGETVTVAGNFNSWDPFMYELPEKAPGVYSLILPLPPGIYQYVFFHRGQRILDPHNTRRVYTREGHVASEAVVR